MFDPTNALNGHIALLTMVKGVEGDMVGVKGLMRSVMKGAGQLIYAELEASRKRMSENRMWVQAEPVGDRCYSYALNGRREQIEISQSDLNLHVGMALKNIEQQLDKAKAQAK
ncbi:hypothetical protein [Cohnella abietis]|uniref:Uncharacterized protein n=1 Tax=Cohnella abietis TaxID=2507935 RepID=A0A3T1D2W0_9BACL|nr:hypothetical protein [Cohnella abietis]BBI32381.1 hypothetical protein KCTCHS21_17800 [Cohnella abietis]